MRACLAPALLDRHRRKLVARIQPKPADRCRRDQAGHEHGIQRDADRLRRPAIDQPDRAKRERQGDRRAAWGCHATIPSAGHRAGRAAADDVGAAAIGSATTRKRIGGKAWGAARTASTGGNPAISSTLCPCGTGSTGIAPGKETDRVIRAAAQALKLKILPRNSAVRSASVRSASGGISVTTSPVSLLTTLETMVFDIAS